MATWTLVHPGDQQPVYRRGRHKSAMNVLFICSLNHARSIAAERLYRRTPGLGVRSAGIDPRARHRVNEKDLVWADRIFVFEPGHESWIRRSFAGNPPEIVNLGIPDDFTVDDPRLVAELRESLEPMLGKPGKGGGR